MTKEELTAAYAAENHHILYDLDADADLAVLRLGVFGYGPADDGILHCVAPVHIETEPTG